MHKGGKGMYNNIMSKSLRASVGRSVGLVIRDDGDPRRSLGRVGQVRPGVDFGVGVVVESDGVGCDTTPKIKRVNRNALRGND